LHQLAEALLALAPDVRFLSLLFSRTPQTRLAHHLAQCLASNLNLVLLPQVLAGQRWPKAAVPVFRQNADDAIPHLGFQLSV
jgi:hypothetical protein